MLSPHALKDEDGLPAIYRAISQYDITALTTLLETDDVDINEFHDELINPLYYAIGTNNYDMVKLLLDSNALVDAPPPLITSHSHLVHAIQVHAETQGEYQCSTTESSHTNSISSSTPHLSHDNSPSDRANSIDHSRDLSCHVGSSPIIDIIISHYNLNGVWFLPSHIVFHDDHILFEFLKRKVDIHVRDDKKRTVLYHALALAKPLSMIKLLLDYGATTNYIYGNNDNALHIALIHYPKHRHHELYDIIKLLLHHGADPNISRCMSNMTPLHLATTQGVSHEIMKVLLDYGGDLTLRAYDRTNILHSCVKHSKDKDGLMTTAILDGYIESILSKDGASPEYIQYVLVSDDHHTMSLLPPPPPLQPSLSIPATTTTTTTTAHIAPMAVTTSAAPTLDMTTNIPPTVPIAISTCDVVSMSAPINTLLDGDHHHMNNPTSLISLPSSGRQECPPLLIAEYLPVLSSSTAPGFEDITPTTTENATMSTCPTPFIPNTISTTSSNDNNPHHHINMNMSVPTAVNVAPGSSVSGSKKKRKQQLQQQQQSQRLFTLSASSNSSLPLSTLPHDCTHHQPPPLYSEQYLAQQRRSDSSFSKSLYKHYYHQLQQQQPKRYVFPHLKLKKQSKTSLTSSSSPLSSSPQPTPPPTTSPHHPSENN